MQQELSEEKEAEVRKREAQLAPAASTRFNWSNYANSCFSCCSLLFRVKKKGSIDAQTQTQSMKNFLFVRRAVFFFSFGVNFFAFHLFCWFNCARAFDVIWARKKVCWATRERIRANSLSARGDTIEKHCVCVCVCCMLSERAPFCQLSELCQLPRLFLSLFLFLCMLTCALLTHASCFLATNSAGTRSLCASVNCWAQLERRQLVQKSKGARCEN